MTNNEPGDRKVESRRRLHSALVTVLSYQYTRWSDVALVAALVVYGETSLDGIAIRRVLDARKGGA